MSYYETLEELSRKFVYNESEDLVAYECGYRNGEVELAKHLVSLVDSKIESVLSGVWKKREAGLVVFDEGWLRNKLREILLSLE